MRRDRFTMRIDVLEALRKPIILTHIIYKTRINYDIIKQELRNLIAKNLVTITPPPEKPLQKYTKRTNSKHPHYILTPEGLEVLKSLKNIAVLLE